MLNKKAYTGPGSIAALITEMKGDRTYRKLSEESGHRITMQRWQQMATGERTKEFPEMATMVAVAETLPARIGDVVSGFLRAGGVESPDISNFAARIAPILDQLSPEAQAQVLNSARGLLTIEKNAAGTARPAPKAKKAKPRPRRDVPPLS